MDATTPPETDPIARSGIAPVDPSAERASGRIGGLDALRGLAALGVVLFHYTVIYGSHYGYNGPVLFRFWGGFYGVHLFFLISGFVIFMTVEKTRRPIDFLVSRFARLYPAYWVAVALAFLALAAFPRPVNPVGLAQLGRRAIVNLTMIQGWVGVTSIDGAYWTLQVEMTFYAIMLSLLCSGRVRWAIPTLCTLVVLGVVQGLLPPAADHPLLGRLRSILALDYLHVLTIGVLIFEFRRAPKGVHLPLIALLLLVPFSQHRPYQEPAKDAAVTASFAWIVFLATTGRIPWLENRALVFLGAISYTLYLTHDTIGGIAISRLDRAGLNHDLAIATAIVLAVVVATALSFLVERPAMRAIRRRSAVRRGPAPVPAPA